MSTYNKVQLPNLSPKMNKVSSDESLRCIKHLRKKRCPSVVDTNHLVDKTDWAIAPVSVTPNPTQLPKMKFKKIDRIKNIENMI